MSTAKNAAAGHRSVFNLPRLSPFPKLKPIAIAPSHTATSSKDTTTRDRSPMDPEAALTSVVDSASGALRSRAMVPSAMLTAGVFQAVAALALLFSKTPEGIFSNHGNGNALVVLYYVVLVAGAIIGSTTASASFWVARRLDLDGRHAIGLALLCTSTLTLIPVFGILAGFVMLRK